MNIVWAPIGYEAVVKEPRWITEREVTVRELVPLAIEERVDGDAPVVIEGNRPYRHDGQDWLRPILDTAGKPTGSFPDMNVAAAWSDYPFSCPTPYSRVAHSPTEKADIKYSSRPGRLADVQSECEGLRVVDGSLWRRCSEPVIVVRFAEPCLVGKITIDLLPGGSTDGDAALFRLDDGDGAARFVKTLRANGHGSGPAKPRFQLLRDVPVEADLFRLRAEAMRNAFSEVLAEFPIRLTDVEDVDWQRCLELAEVDNDWEFMDAIETACDSEHPDIGVVMNYLTRHHRAILWRQVEVDLETSRLHSAFGA